MARFRVPYPPEFRRQMVELVRSGRTPQDLAREFEPTAAGFLFLAVVLDAWSRRIVGWAMADDLHTQLVLDALDMAFTTRKPADVVHHSDQGSQPGFTRIAHAQ